MCESVYFKLIRSECRFWMDGKPEVTELVRENLRFEPRDYPQQPGRREGRPCVPKLSFLCLGSQTPAAKHLLLSFAARQLAQHSPTLSRGKWVII
jgi:hypothetical protein